MRMIAPRRLAVVALLLGANAAPARLASNRLASNRLFAHKLAPPRRPPTPSPRQEARKHTFTANPAAFEL